MEEDDFEEEADYIETGEGEEKEEDYSLEDDAITAEEEGFLKGYDEAEEEKEDKESKDKEDNKEKDSD